MGPQNKYSMLHLEIFSVWSWTPCRVRPHTDRGLETQYGLEQTKNIYFSFNPCVNLNLKSGLWSNWPPTENAHISTRRYSVEWEMHHYKQNVSKQRACVRKQSIPASQHHETLWLRQTVVDRRRTRPAPHHQECLIPVQKAGMLQSIRVWGGEAVHPLIWKRHQSCPPCECSFEGRRKYLIFAWKTILFQDQWMNYSVVPTFSFFLSCLNWCTVTSQTLIMTSITTMITFDQPKVSFLPGRQELWDPLHAEVPKTVRWRLIPALASKNGPGIPQTPSVARSDKEHVSQSVGGQIQLYFLAVSRDFLGYLMEAQATRNVIGSTPRN